ncbi:MAG: hypothetical protein H7Y43_09780 [Akkermansiaceae bacterium]|nr:hypothetical protein [Verrucomicrobiales bacterium]
MKTKSLLIALLTLTAAPAFAQDARSAFSASSTSLDSIPWDVSQSHWDRISQQRSSIPELHLGKSDFVIGGPLVESFRRKRLPSDASLGRKFLALPVVSSFVPQKMASPPGGTGSYFAWRGNTRSWSEIPKTISGDSAFSPAYHEPQGRLISIRGGSR